MGTRGPQSKRSNERTRRNKTGEDGIALKKGVAQEYAWEEPGEDWDDAVKRMYLSLSQTGMSAYFQQSDVDYAWLICDEFSEYRKSPRKSAVMFAGLISSLNGLGITEGERRRMHIELDLPQKAVKSAGVVAIEDYKKGLGVA